MNGQTGQSWSPIVHSRHGGRESPTGHCKPSCCKTPLGHSGAAPITCTCHVEPKETKK